MARKLPTLSGALIYAKRQWVVEPVFGQIKQARGLRQLLLRGLWKTQAEWALICTSHNLFKLHASLAWHAARSRSSFRSPDPILPIAWRDEAPQSATH